MVRKNIEETQRWQKKGNNKDDVKMQASKQTKTNGDDHQH